MVRNYTSVEFSGDGYVVLMALARPHAKTWFVFCLVSFFRLFDGFWALFFEGCGLVCGALVLKYCFVCGCVWACLLSVMLILF